MGAMLDLSINVLISALLQESEPCYAYSYAYRYAHLLGIDSRSLTYAIPLAAFCASNLVVFSY